MRPLAARILGTIGKTEHVERGCRVRQDTLGKGFVNV